ncbi:MAG: lactate utilization protein [Deltaproteobacteria bacterium]|jgi:L-lactate dehydrogenase complex protein LldG|nr:lactate utilization protein [Deltaproteobacteria bacterium]
MDKKITQFIQALRNVGGVAEVVKNAADAVAHIGAHLQGPLLAPDSHSLQQAGLKDFLSQAGIEMVCDDFRANGAKAAGGLTGANFGIAATGTVVLESTDENVRIASTLPEKHIVALDPAKIVSDYNAALPIVRKLHEQWPQVYLAYLTGPSRTADIERVLTIGVHGPRELHVLLLEGISSDFMER